MQREVYFSFAVDTCSPSFSILNGRKFKLLDAKLVNEINHFTKHKKFSLKLSLS